MRADQPPPGGDDPNALPADLANAVHSDQGEAGLGLRWRTPPERFLTVTGIDPGK